MVVVSDSKEYYFIGNLSVYGSSDDCEIFSYMQQCFKTQAGAARLPRTLVKDMSEENARVAPDRHRCLLDLPRSILYQECDHLDTPNVNLTNICCKLYISYISTARWRCQDCELIHASNARRKTCERAALYQGMCMEAVHHDTTVIWRASGCWQMNRQ